jgi:hypothetical protein
MTMRVTIPIDPKPAARCERWVGSDGYLVCDRCGSMWSQLLHGLGWLPLSCPDRLRSRGGEKEDTRK